MALLGNSSHRIGLVANLKFKGDENIFSKINLCRMSN